MGMACTSWGHGFSRASTTSNPVPIDDYERCDCGLVTWGELRAKAFGCGHEATIQAQAKQIAALKAEVERLTIQRDDARGERNKWVETAQNISIQRDALRARLAKYEQEESHADRKLEQLLAEVAGMEGQMVSVATARILAQKARQEEADKIQAVADLNIARARLTKVERVVEEARRVTTTWRKWSVTNAEQMYELGQAVADYIESQAAGEGTAFR